MSRDPGATFAHELGRGAVVLAPDGRDISAVVRASFARLLPACGGDRAEAASQAVASALAGQRREEA